MENKSKQAQPPLVVDLDGTLIQTDLLFESFVRVAKRYPWLLFFMPVWFSRGLAQLKHELALRAAALIDFNLLPINHLVLDYLRDEKGHGRYLVLASGSNSSLVQAVAQRFDIFDRVIASDEEHNLTGSNKALKLCEIWGEKGFDYVGNEAKDVRVWEHANAAIVVGDGELVALAGDAAPVEKTIVQEKPSIKVILRAMRPHQWSKNALMFVPLVTAHLFFDSWAITLNVIAFLCFGLIASATYILNDLFDLDADRCHRTKCERPFASGEAPIKLGLQTGAILVSVGILLSFFLPWTFQLTLLVYTIITLSYSFRLKAVAGLDILILSFLYTVRVVAGAMSITVDLSFWLLAFSMFLFFSLAIVKRVSELITMEMQNKSKPQGRGYSVDDKVILVAMGCASGFLSILVFALYINSPNVVMLYEHEQLLWPICLFLLHWITRVWLLTARGQMHEDPVVFAIRDKGSWLTFGLVALILFIATGQINS